MGKSGLTAVFSLNQHLQFVYFSASATANNSNCPSNTCTLARLRGQRTKSTNKNCDNGAISINTILNHPENRRQRQLTYTTTNNSVSLKHQPHDSLLQFRKKVTSKKSTHRFKSTGIVASTAVQPKLRGRNTSMTHNASASFNNAAATRTNGNKQTVSQSTPSIIGGIVSNPNQHHLQPINNSLAGQQQSKVKRFVRHARSQLKLLKSSTVNASNVVASSTNGGGGHDEIVANTKVSRKTPGRKVV